MQAIYNIYCYKQKVKGKIYKNSLSNLVKGLGGAISLIIILRVFQSLTGFFNKQSLAALLLIIYLLLIALAVCYIFIYKGASSLKRIEKV